ncbi:hypothetical protein ACCC88_10765 [Sphingomonas sp. Sphisp140]|uniref:hypothetical protein n=1 Tax=unclassified Sphingomonas TaxID=196159 RepID=UPI0039AFCE86
MSARMILGGLAAAALLGCHPVVASGNNQAPANVAAETPVVAAPVNASVAADGQLAWSQDPGSKCRFVAPKSLTAGPTNWIGECPGGKASGLGVLVRRDGGKATATFYGELREGVPVIGAINVDGGYVVGKFTGDDLVQGDLEPQVRIDSFNVAAKAARAASARFQAQKNAASARFYADAAKQLDLQVE